MPADVDKILVGAGTFSIGPWVTAGGAGTLVVIGHTDAITITPNHESLDISSSQIKGTARKVPTLMSFTVVIPVKQAEPENIRVALKQPAANLSGTPPNMTLLVGEPAEQYHQATILTKGHGTTAARTFTLWRLVPVSVGEMTYDRDGIQMVPVTFEALYDESATTLDKFWKAADA